MVFQGVASMLSCSCLFCCHIHQRSGHTCNLPIATKQYLLVLTCFPCLHPEWSCLEKTQEQSFVRTADWKHVEILMTNMFISTSFSNEMFCCNITQGPVWESLCKNVFTIPLIASAQYFCPRLPDSSGVCSCIMIYFSHLKPVAKWLLFLDVVVPCLCGVNGTWSHGRWESGQRTDSCPGVCLSVM